MERYFDKISLFKIIIIFVVVAIIIGMASEVEILKNKSVLDENFWMTVANSTVLIYFIWSSQGSNFIIYCICSTSS